MGVVAIWKRMRLDLSSLTIVVVLGNIKYIRI